MENYYWYHTEDLGSGLVTPGSYDFRFSISDYDFPEDMHGMRVLDIGSATGFFAFEFERRGAEVTSVELPSLADLDRFPGQSAEDSLVKLRRMLSEQTLQTEATPLTEFSDNQIYHLLLDGPFQFCRKILGSKIRRCYSTIYELSPAVLGESAFDLIFIGDVLLHTLRPLDALAPVARLCRGTLGIAQFMPETESERPVMVYVGGNNPAEDDVSWWLPNKSCFAQILRKLGFRMVEDVGRHSVLMRQTGETFDQTILHATK